MTYRLIELECLEKALEKYRDIAATFMDVPKPMPPLYRKEGVNTEGKWYNPEMFQTAENYWAGLLAEHITAQADGNEPFKRWKDDDGWHGEVKCFGYLVRVTCRYNNGEGHMVSLWKTNGDEPQLIISDEPEEELE